MENLYEELSLSVEILKTGKKTELKRALDTILKVMNARLNIPVFMIKIIMIRVCGVAKTKENLFEAFEILTKILFCPDYAEWLYENEEDSKMQSTVLLSSLVINIERDDSVIRKVA